jgi:hypothetical protein
LIIKDQNKAITADEGSRGLAAGFLLTTALMAVKEAMYFMVGSQYSNAPASAG